MNNEKTNGLTFYALLSVLQGGMWLLNDIETFLRAYDISHGRFWILLHIQNVGTEQVMPAQLARNMGKSKPTITKLLQRLEQDGFIRSRGDRADGRAKKLVLTQKAEELLQRIVPVYTERLNQMGANLTNSEKQQLMQLISKVDFLDKQKRIRIK